MVLPPLTGIPYPDQEMLKDFCRAVLERIDPYRIFDEHSGNRTKPNLYRLQYLDGSLPENYEVYTRQFDALKPLNRMGYLQWELDPPGYIVSDLALEWFRRSFPATDSEIRRRIGRILFDEYKSTGNPAIFHVGQIADSMNIAQPRVVGQVRVLFGERLIRQVGRFATYSTLEEMLNDPRVAEYNLSLTEPEGVSWAQGGFKEAGPLQNNVNVDIAVTITIRQFIQDIRKLDLSEEQKEEAQDIVVEIQEEPTIEKVSRMMSMAANTQQLLPAVIRFFSENGHSILENIQKLPH